VYDNKERLEARRSRKGVTATFWLTVCVCVCEGQDGKKDQDKRRVAKKDSKEEQEENRASESMQRGSSGVDLPSRPDQAFP
jgi:hypothetical protein